MFGLGYGELLVILAIVVLLFGAKKLPMLGGAIGESIKNFKKGIRDESSGQIADSKSSTNGPKSENDKQATDKANKPR